MYTAENAKVVPLLRTADTRRVRGSIIQLHVDWLRQYGSRAEIIALFESLDAGLRHQVLAAQPAQWYRFGVIVEMQIAIASHFANGDEGFIEKIGAFSAYQEMAPLRDYLDRQRVHDFFRTTAVLHRETVDFGSADYVAAGACGGTMIVTGLAAAATHRGYLRGFYREVIVQHRAHDATIREQLPGTFDMCWR